MISPDRFPRLQTSHLLAAIVQGPLVTADATPHTKGAWTSLLAATSFDTYLLGVCLSDVGATGVYTGTLVDIGIDPAGGTTYTVIIPNILAGAATPLAEGGVQLWFPVFIPKGSQIAARSQAAVVSDTVRVGVECLGGHNRSNPFPHRGAIQDYGTNLADSGGTAMANTSPNSKGAWTQLGADTTRRHSGLVVAAGGSGSIMVTNSQLIDIGVDPAGGTSYTVVIPNIFCRGVNTEKALNNDYLTALLDLDIPAGSAIAARSQTGGSNDNDRMDVAVYAF